MMRSGKDLHLVNIYIKIHNRGVLTMDDLAYLAKYNPECFQKTCENLLYKMPETKGLMKPDAERPAPEAASPQKTTFDGTRSAGDNIFELTEEQRRRTEQMILQVLQNLRALEASEVSALQGINVDSVKELLGDLFMENLFPHSGRQAYFEMPGDEPTSTFNARV